MVRIDKYSRMQTSLFVLVLLVIFMLLTFLSTCSYDDVDTEYQASFFISLKSGILTLIGQTEFDLNGDGVWEFGILELIMNRS